MEAGHYFITLADSVDTDSSDHDFHSFMSLHNKARQTFATCKVLMGTPHDLDHELTVHQNACDALDMAAVLFGEYNKNGSQTIVNVAWRWLAIAGELFALDIVESLPVQDEELWNSYYCEDLTDHAHGWRCAVSQECPNCEGMHCSAALRCECGTWLTLSKTA
jgi:hypothetical protein